MPFTTHDFNNMQIVLSVTREGIEKGNWPFGACIASEDRLVIAAHNVVVTTHDPTAHAEINAIRLACAKLTTIDLKEYTIYTSSAPCPMCFSAIYWAGIRRIVYSSYPEDYSILGFTGLGIPPEKMAELGHLKINIMGGLMRKEVKELIGLYHKKYGSVY